MRHIHNLYIYSFRTLAQYAQFLLIPKEEYSAIKRSDNDTEKKLRNKYLNENGVEAAEPKVMYHFFHTQYMHTCKCRWNKEF